MLWVGNKNIRAVEQTTDEYSYSDWRSCAWAEGAKTTQHWWNGAKHKSWITPWRMTRFTWNFAVRSGIDIGSRSCNFFVTPWLWKEINLKKQILLNFFKFSKCCSLWRHEYLIQYHFTTGTLSGIIRSKVDSFVCVSSHLISWSAINQSQPGAGLLSTSLAQS